MLDLQQIENTYALWVAGVILVHAICAPFIALAARRKNRNYASFLILALILGPLIAGLEVAKLPFSDEDPKAPQIEPDFRLEDSWGSDMEFRLVSKDKLSNQSRERRIFF